MPRYNLIVLTNPVDGREDEYNDWYTNVHLDDVLKVPGVVAAQRFRRSNHQRDQGRIRGNTWLFTNVKQTMCGV